eukprot:TRINITY_DN2978_c0_g1_i2.p1 TRINITY_DN2978_c0_g1~~TRINITY_DN2978_c0_g1_i2.p1  ORF type:complete len:187 (+),score=19.41 TRINITY_DN2978_c0_g1_i2:110-670(+)
MIRDSIVIYLEKGNSLPKSGNFNLGGEEIKVEEILEVKRGLDANTSFGKVKGALFVAIMMILGSIAAFAYYIVCPDTESYRVCHPSGCEKRSVLKYNMLLLALSVGMLFLGILFIWMRSKLRVKELQRARSFIIEENRQGWREYGLEWVFDAQTATVTLVRISSYTPTGVTPYDYSNGLEVPLAKA